METFVVQIRPRNGAHRHDGGDAVPGARGQGEDPLDHEERKGRDHPREPLERRRLGHVARPGQALGDVQGRGRSSTTWMCALMSEAGGSRPGMSDKPIVGGSASSAARAPAPVPNTRRRPGSSAGNCSGAASGLVYGGGRVGLMYEVARVVHEGGGEVIGVIPRDMVEKELAYTDIRDLRVVGTMHERKALMAEPRRRLRRPSRRAGDHRGDLRGPDLGPARHAPEPLRLPQRGGILRRASGVPGSRP